VLAEQVLTWVCAEDVVMTGHQSPVYDRIGGGYVAGRREDPRIARAIWEALGGARAVVNVGAGTGSYEPTDRRVVAVEPSAVMLTQRPAGAAPAVQASAEALPFSDDEFDAAMAVLSVHHWTDKRQGLAEMRRVARGPVIVFGRVAEASPWWWLYEYFPATAGLVAARETPLGEFEAALGLVEQIPVPIPADCVDGFEAAYWQRPGALLDPNVWRAMSALALIPEPDRVDGMRRLRSHLESGEWEHRWSGLLDIDELDLGYRVLVAHG
jgi:SAM-dependent methyltransferase